MLRYALIPASLALAAALATYSTKPPTAPLPQLAQYGGPPMWDRDPSQWGPEEQRRRLPPREYDPYDRGPERFRPAPPPMPREEYERRAFCAMHPRDCR